MTTSSTNKRIFTFRELIWLLSLVLTFSASYFPMKAKVNKNSELLNKYNLELIDYRLNEIQKELEAFRSNFDAFITDFNKYTRESRR